jgi:SPP1 family predicted phage head-tail adaptor
MSLRTVSGYEPIGAMDRWITFLATGATAGDGGPGTPGAVKSAWASIRGLQGGEIDRAQQIEQKCSHIVKIPWQPDIQESMQVQYIDGGQTRILQINYIEDPDEHRFELRLYCMEIGQNAGGSS